MPDFPLPSNEEQRLKEVQGLRFAEWDTRKILDDLCIVAARLLGTPIAHLSLVDRYEQLFAGKYGLDADRTGREVAFCAHTIMEALPFIVEDAANDPRFSQNPLVTDTPRIGSYLGVPLETAPGLRVGALCAVDRKPRAFTEADIRTLEKLGAFAVLIIKGFRAALDFNDQMTSAIELQKKMLPSKARIKAIEDALPLELASRYKALDGVGGDIWGTETLGPHCLLLFIADFTGHGLAAALNMARFHSFAHMECHRADDPAQILRRLNRRLIEVLPVGQFATMFCAVLDFEAQIIKYASAGSPPQLYRRSSSAAFELLAKPAVPLGILQSAVYESETLPFQPGATLVLYTDALIETPRPPNQIFTPESLKRLVSMDPSRSAAELRAKIMNALLVDPTVPIDDDITLVIALHTNEPMTPLLNFSI